MSLRIAILALGLALARPVWAAEPATPTPAEVGVRVEKPAGDGVHYQQGSGVYLGDGLVLTAAHVVKLDPTHNKVVVLIDGVRTDGEVVFNGDAHKIDLALIRLVANELTPKRRTQPQVHVCPANAAPNRSVMVASMGTVTAATTIPSAVSTIGAGGDWTNILSTGYHHGNSGGGVFDPGHDCLWGILVQELSGRLDDGRNVDLTAFVPTRQIDAFLADFAKQGRTAE
jgi:hypothetical protein